MACNDVIAQKVKRELHCACVVVDYDWCCMCATLMSHPHVTELDCRGCEKVHSPMEHHCVASHVHTCASTYTYTCMFTHRYIPPCFLHLVFIRFASVVLSDSVQREAISETSHFESHKKNNHDGCKVIRRDVNNNIDLECAVVKVGVMIFDVEEIG